MKRTECNGSFLLQFCFLLILESFSHTPFTPSPDTHLMSSVLNGEIGDDSFWKMSCALLKSLNVELSVFPLPLQDYKILLQYTAVKLFVCSLHAKFSRFTCRSYIYNDNRLSYNCRKAEKHARLKVKVLFISQSRLVNTDVLLFST